MYSLQICLSLIKQISGLPVGLFHVKNRVFYSSYPSQPLFDWNVSSSVSFLTRMFFAAVVLRSTWKAGHSSVSGTSETVCMRTKSCPQIEFTRMACWFYASFLFNTAVTVKNQTDYLLQWAYGGKNKTKISQLYHYNNLVIFDIVEKISILAVRFRKESKQWNHSSALKIRN